MIDAMILAAGNSRRFGDNKLLYGVGGKPMYCHVLDHLYGLVKQKVINRLVIVTQYESIMQNIEDNYPLAKAVFNEAPDKGITGSIHIGLKMIGDLNPDSEACLFAVADQPFMKKMTFLRLFDTWQASSAGIIYCSSSGVSGNPVIFSRDYYEELLALEGDRGGKQVVKRHKEDALVFEVAEEELLDIDKKSFFSED